MAFGLDFIIMVVLGLVFLVIVFYVILIFNTLIRLKNNIRKSLANIEVLLKQRNDELPKLIASVKGYMKHERKTLEALTKARTAFMNATTIRDKAKADSIISGALKTLFAVAENYPNLKANENFLQLQNRITGIENELADRREFYNDSVNIYNIRIQSIPDRFIAKLLGYQPEEFFKAEESEKKDVEINF